MHTHRKSLIAFWVGAALILASAFFYYPKWQQRDTEATLSWDVSGYYFYLPAFFIYHDARELAWRDSIFDQYRPTPALQQAFLHQPSGHYVMKYSLGQALQMLPWFTVAHLLAEPLGYPADGFSKPYQTTISWGSLLVALIGLWYLRRSLLRYFPDGTVAAVLLCLVFGSNYLNYTAFDGAMTHNWLFTLYSLLIFNSIQFYDRPTRSRAALIGLLVGWAVLTRPTEILAVLIPLLWAWDGLRARLAFFQKNWLALGGAAVAGGAVIFLQLAYWKYAGGEWIIYSYEDQGFSWLRPHVLDGLFSFRAGWLIYSPMLAFAVLGLLPLRRQVPAVFPAVLVFSLLFAYVTWAWDIWWYGGSLGQRAMVQSYPVWAFALAATVEWARARRWASVALPLLAGFFCWHNLWWTHQAHRGGLFVTEQMTKYYWLAVWGRSEVPRSTLKLLDTKDEHYPHPKESDLKPVLAENFDADTTVLTTADRPISGGKSLILNKNQQFSPEYAAPLLLQNGNRGVRATCTFRCDEKEWDWWRMTQMIVRVYEGDRKVKERSVRLQRHVDGNEQQTLWFDTRLPTDGHFDRVSVLFWNADSDKTVRIDDVKVEQW